MSKTKQQVNDQVTKIRRSLHKQHCHVSKVAVLKQACQELGVNRLSDLGVRDPDQLSAVQEIQQLERLLLVFIDSYMSCR